MKDIFFCKHDFEHCVACFDNEDDAIEFAKKNAEVSSVQHWQTDGIRRSFIGNVWERL